MISPARDSIFATNLTGIGAFLPSSLSYQAWRLHHCRLLLSYDATKQLHTDAMPSCLLKETRGKRVLKSE